MASRPPRVLAVASSPRIRAVAFVGRSLASRARGHSLASRRHVRGSQPRARSPTPHWREVEERGTSEAGTRGEWRWGSGAALEGSGGVEQPRARSPATTHHGPVEWGRDPRGDLIPQRGRGWGRSSLREVSWGRGWGGFCPHGDGSEVVTSDGEFPVDILTHGHTSKLQSKAKKHTQMGEGKTATKLNIYSKLLVCYHRVILLQATLLFLAPASSNV